MAVFIKDTLGLRRIIWSLLVVSGCIDCVQAAIVSTITLSPSDQVTGHEIYRITSGGLTITCGHTGQESGTATYRLDKDGKDVTFTTPATHEYAITTFDASTHAGIYTCIFNDDNGDVESKATTVTLVCQNHDSECGPGNDVYKCDKQTVPTKPFCKCEIRGVFMSLCDKCSNTYLCGNSVCSPDTPAALPRKCVACLAADNDECAFDGKTPECDATIPNAATCVACTAGFCSKINSTKVCDTTTGKPDSGKCVDKPAAGTTGVSGGTTKQDGGATGSGTTPSGGDNTNTSSAGTVTSTACLVIASVVVALMN